MWQKMDFQKLHIISTASYFYSFAATLSIKTALN